MIDKIRLWLLRRLNPYQWRCETYPKSLAYRAENTYLYGLRMNQWLDGASDQKAGEFPVSDYLDVDDDTLVKDLSYEA